MEKQHIKDYIIFSILSVMTIFLLYQTIKEKRQIKKQIDMSLNITHDVGADKTLDTILHVALKYYDLKGLDIGIRYITSENTQVDQKRNLSGYTISDSNNYLITMIPTSKIESIRIIAHEVTHIKQLYNKEIVLTSDKFIWMNKEMNEIPYDKRPWEIEAFGNETIIEEYILNNL